jgi:hypothetical protein
MVDNFGNMDLGACMWCRTCSVGCSTAQCQRRGGARKAQTESKPTSGKRKVSKVEESEDDEGEGTLSKKVKLWWVIEDSDKEGDWLQDREDRPKKDMGEVEVAEEVWASLASEAEVQEETEDKGKGKAMVLRSVLESSS